MFLTTALCIHAVKTLDRRIASGINNSS